MSAVGMVLILHAFGVLIVLALILFGVVSVTIVKERNPPKKMYKDLKESGL